MAFFFSLLCFFEKKQRNASLLFFLLLPPLGSVPLSTVFFFFLFPPIFPLFVALFLSPSLSVLPLSLLPLSVMPFFSSPFLVLCPVFSVQDEDKGGKSTRCCWLMDQNFPLVLFLSQSFSCSPGFFVLFTGFFFPVL